MESTIYSNDKIENVKLKNTEKNEKFRFQGIESVSREEWLQASQSEVATELLPIVAGYKMPSRLINGEIFPISWKDCRLDGIDATGALWTYKNKSGKKQLVDARLRKEYGFGVRLGKVLAIDSDVTDGETSERLLQILTESSGRDELPLRRRSNSCRWACLVRIDGLNEHPNGIGKLPNGEDVELKGKDHQLVVCGIHPSGGKYCWTGGSVCEVVNMSVEAWNCFLSRAAEELGVSWEDAGKNTCKTFFGGRVSNEFRTDLPAEMDYLGKWLIENGYAVQTSENRLDFISCPWSSEHSSNSDNTPATSYFLGTVQTRPGFHCFHAHCQSRTVADVREWAKGLGFQACSSVPVEAVSAEEEKLAPANSDLEVIKMGRESLVVDKAAVEDFYAKYEKVTIKKDGSAEKTVDCRCESMRDFIDSPALCGYDIRHDSFSDKILIRRSTEKEFKEIDLDKVIFELRIVAENVFKKPMTKMKGLIEDAITQVAQSEGHAFDSGKEMIASLPVWDGVSRLETVFSKYLGTVDSEGTRALSAYFFRHLVARVGGAKASGVKADILPIFFGAQKVGKSRAVKALTLGGDAFFSDSIRFDNSDVENVRATLGKTMIEIAELGGLKGGRKDRDDIKAWVTRASDQMRDCFEKRPKDHPRRWMAVITTNEQSILRDPTGDRRFAPIRIAEMTATDVDALQKAMPQICAEAKFLNDQEGIENLWKTQVRVEDALPSLQEGFSDEDPWTSAVLSNAYNRNGFFSCTDILEDALEYKIKDISRREKGRVADILKKAGYESGKHGWRRTDKVTAPDTSSSFASSPSPSFSPRTFVPANSYANSYGYADYNSAEEVCF